MSLWIAAGALTLAIGVVAYSATCMRAQAKHEGLFKRLPAPAGWEARDLSIATSEEMKRALAEYLNYDAAVFREYRRGAHVIYFYAAHWRPGKFHPRLIAAHTPDACWQGGGWRVTRRDDRHAVAGAGRYHPAHFRAFERPDATTQVIFWHVVDGRPSGYLEGQQTTSGQFLDGWWRDWRQAQGEQFFIRVSASPPWDGWLDEPLVQEILRTFEPVLAAR